MERSLGIVGRGRASTAAAAASCARSPAVAVSSGWLSALTKSDTTGKHLHMRMLSKLKRCHALATLRLGDVKSLRRLTG